MRSPLDGPRLKWTCGCAPNDHVVNSWTRRRVTLQPRIVKVEVSCQHDRFIFASEPFGEGAGAFEFGTRDLGTTELI